MRLICLGLVLAAQAAEAAPACLDESALDPRVTVREDGDRLVITAGEASVTIDTPPCDVMTDVVLAESLSLLPDPINVDDLQSAASAVVGEDVILLQRGTGAWVAVVERRACRREALIGPLPSGREARVRRIVAAVARAGDCPQPRLRLVEERALVLEQAIEFDIRMDQQQPLALGLGAAAVSGAVALRAAIDDVGTADAFYVGGAATWALGALLAHGTEDDAVSLAIMTAGAGIGLAGTAFEGDELKESAFVAGGAHLVAAGMILATRLGTPPTSRARLRQIRAGLRSPAARSRLTRDELDALEREFQRSRLGGSRWKWATPFLVGATVSLAMAATHTDDDERGFDVAMAVALGYEAIMIFVVPDWHQKELGKFDLLVGAGTVGVRGAF